MPVDHLRFIKSFRRILYKEFLIHCRLLINIFCGFLTKQLILIILCLGSGYGHDRRMNQRTIARQIALVELIGKGRFGEVRLLSLTLCHPLPFSLYVFVFPYRLFAFK